MRILTRYVVFELLKTFVFALTAFTALMIILLVVHEAMMQNLPPRQILHLIPYTLPQALQVTLPVTLLLSVTSVFSRISGNNEITAVKALGISPWELMWPVFALAFLVSLTGVWLNDVAVSWGRYGVQKVVFEAVEEIVYNMLRVERRYRDKNFSIVVKKVEGRKLILPMVTIRNPPSQWEAAEAELRTNREKSTLELVARDSRVVTEQGGKKISLTYPGEMVHTIPLDHSAAMEAHSRHPSNMPLRRIPHAIEEQKLRIEAYEHKLATKVAFAMIQGDYNDLDARTWIANRDALSKMETRLRRLQAQPHLQWAAGFSCFCFAWIGVPMAIRLQQRDFLTSFFLCFLPILLVYYPLFMFGKNGAKDGIIPPPLIWTGNLLLIAWGSHLLHRVLRH